MRRSPPTNVRFALGLIVLLLGASPAWAGGDGCETPADAAGVLARDLRNLSASGRPLEIQVDLSDAGQAVAHTTMRIPVEPGTVSLVYPRWIQGHHAPVGPIADLTGLKVEADGGPIPWRRDPLDMSRFTVEVPPGVTTLQVSLDYRSPPPGQADSSSSAFLAMVNWHPLLLYPERPLGGGRPLDLPVEASVTLPAGWELATALPVAAQDGRSTTFAPVTLEELTDSPVLAGKHMKTWALGEENGAPNFLSVAADRPGALALAPDQLQALRNLVGETAVLFGARHFDAYHFLLTLSDDVPFAGIEHHQSSDNRLPLDGLRRRGVWRPNGILLPHEKFHSWNGKYRRPEGLVRDDLQSPLDSTLLWIYEGLTNYYGWVLPARSALWTPEYFRDYLAATMEGQRGRVGRTWRPLVDTAVSAQILYEARPDGVAWRRHVDYYPEGALNWLEVDARIRAATGGQKSLDDFLRAFHGGENGPAKVVPYAYEDVVEALQRIAPGDWDRFFKERIESPTPDVPTRGLEAAGWRLTYSTRPGPYQADFAASSGVVDLRSSLGILVDGKTGAVSDVVPFSSAARAGMAPGSVLTQVNGNPVAADRLRDAVAASENTPVRLAWTYGSAAKFRTSLDYRGGARYPVLERIPGTEDLLSQIIASRRETPPAER